MFSNAQWNELMNNTNKRDFFPLNFSFLFSPFLNFKSESTILRQEKNTGELPLSLSVCSYAEVEINLVCFPKF